MKRVVIVLVVLLFVFAIYWFKFRSTGGGNSGPKQEALRVGRHSVLFNNGIDSLMSAYFEMKDAFVDADTLKAKEGCSKMIAIADSLKLDELKKDTAGIYDAATMQVSDLNGNAGSLLQEKDITSMRKDFQMVSESLYPLLKTIHYEGEKLYWQNCPMAFGEGNDASWISNTEEIENPYLGRNNPQYHSAMVGCGEIKDSIVAK
jgi:hypothetical protein